MRIALVVYEGVLDDECEAFRSVLGLLRGAEVVAVGADHGGYGGPGGIQPVDVTFAELERADVVVVPGGLGCERAADDPRLREFLHRMERVARFVAASSTGTVVLASAGLLHGAPAATHWLANDLLRRYGSEADDRRLVISGNVITCEGRISAVDAAFALVERIEGSAAVERTRATLLERGQPLLREPSLWERLLDAMLGRPTLRAPKRPALTPRAFPSARPAPPARPTPAAVDPVHGPEETPPVTPLSVMIELIDDDDQVRRMKRRANRRRGRS